MKCPNLHCLHSFEGWPERCPRCGLPLPGATLDDRFVLERVETATGGAVHFAARVGSDAARVRVLLPRHGQEQTTATIAREVESIRALGPGNMPRILGASFTGPNAWLATDAQTWESVDRHMNREARTLSEKEVFGILGEATKILVPLHERGIAHRGIRADTVYLRNGQHMTMSLPAWEADLEDRTVDPNRAAYLAPEYGRGRATARTDMFALGVLALHLLSGLGGKELAEAARNPESRKAQLGLSGGGFEVLAALLADSISQRVSSAGQLQLLLERLDPEGSGGTLGAGGGGDVGDRADPRASGAAAAAGAASGLGAEVAGDRSQEAAARPAAGRAAAGSRRPEEPRRRGGLAALAALALPFLALRGWIGSLVEKAAVDGALRAKILVAFGLGVATVGAAGFLAAQQVAVSQLERYESRSAMPTPVIGVDDRPVPVAPPSQGPALMARLQAGLQALMRPNVLGTPGAASGPQTRAPEGSRQDTSQTAPGNRVPAAGGPDGGAAPPRAESESGKDNTRAPDDDTPYDAVAEPGTDPDDASGLGKKSRFFVRVNKTYKTLTLYQDGQYAAQYIIAIGKGANTPDGRYTVKRKLASPGYESVPPNDPRNPLGSRWLGMDVRYPGGRSIGIHGTNDEASIGQAASGGCIRMKNADVEQLFDLIPEGTPVEII